MLDFDLIRVMGRDTFPALEMVRKFTRERSSPNAQLEFVLFLDADPGTAEAQFSSEDAFCTTLHRPSAFAE